MKGNLVSPLLFISGEGKARVKDEQDIFQIKEDEVSLRFFIPGDVKLKADKEGRGSFRILAVNFFGGEICVQGFLEKKAREFYFRIQEASLVDSDLFIFSISTGSPP